MSKFISRIHDDLRGARPPRRGATAHPDTVPQGLHKEYPRMPRIPLPAPAPLTSPFGDVLAKRASFNRAHTDRAFTAAELGTLLGHALGMRDGSRRKYPSGGGLYPIESYLIGNVLEGYAPGVFHYHPKAHALEHLWDVPNFKMSEMIRSAITPLSQTLILFTGVWDRASAKYGDWAYHLAMLEAGHMGQNIVLTATAAGMQARPAGGFGDDVVAELLDIDDREQALHAILLSPERAGEEEIPGEIHE